MKPYDRKNGSITPFCALCLMLISSLILVLLESSRVYTLDRVASLQADNGIDSVCAEFQPFLWQQYGMLFLDGAYGAKYFSMDYVKETLEERIEKNEVWTLTIADIVLQKYALATDGEGSLFLQYVAEREKENLPIGLAEDLLEQYNKGNEIEKEHQMLEEDFSKAQQLVDELDAIDQSKMEEKVDLSPLKDLFGQIGEMKSVGILSLLLEDETTVSDKTLGGLMPIGERKVAIGNWSMLPQNDWYQKILALQYIEEYFTNYCLKNEAHYLDYEMEYVLCGKDTEAENLCGTLEKLILLRQGYNMIALMQDQAKLAKAEKLANVIGLLAAENPVAVQVAKVGVIIAWAYLESVLDMRALMAGEKIALIKNKSEWTSDILRFPEVMSKATRAKNCENGMTYTDYLKQLLFFTTEKHLSYRMMEAMELSMWQKEDYENCQMDHMVVAMQYQIDFKTTPLFSKLATIGDSYGGQFYFRKQVKRSYIP